ncbi:hypothetical protein NEOLEDRAFT_1204359, partial [Neolentinus lepideus HHB14362 ss-1]
MDRGRLHRAHSAHWGTMELTENKTVCFDSEIHWVPMGSRGEDSRTANRETHGNTISDRPMVGHRGKVQRTRCGPPSWEASPRSYDLPSNSTFPPLHFPLRIWVQITTGSAPSPRAGGARSHMGEGPPPQAPEHIALVPPRAFRLRLVGRCQHLIWNRSCRPKLLGCVDLGTRVHGRARSHVRHRVGRSNSSRARVATYPSSRPAEHITVPPCQPPGPLRQQRCCYRRQQGPITIDRNQCCPEGSIFHARCQWHTPDCRVHPQQRQRDRCTVERRYPCLPTRVSSGNNTVFTAATPTPPGQAGIIVMPASALRVTLPTILGAEGSIETIAKLDITPSPLRPPCRAEERIHQWRGINTPIPSTIDNPLIRHLADIASRASLRDAASYGAGLRKFHLFCDIFSVPEVARLPASFALLHSFVLWAVTDPDPSD